VIRVVVTGSECTGKSTLASALAAHFDLPAPAEAAREFVRRERRAPTAGDVDAIAHEHLAIEARLASAHSGLAILDTDLLSTVVYARHYYGDVPDWVESHLRRNPADLYLLAGIDVPWVADRLQRDRGHRRREMQALFREALAALSARYVEISGPPGDRMRTALAAIGSLRGDRRGRPEPCPPR